MIGLKYCSAFLERIPRDEVMEIENIVCKIIIDKFYMNF
jgi:hypothetical protein